MNSEYNMFYLHLHQHPSKRKILTQEKKELLSLSARFAVTQAYEFEL